MSALRIPFLVMRTLIVPTVTGLLAVLVKQDSLELALFVKVCGAFIVKNKAKPYSSRVTNSVFLFYHIQTSMSALRILVLVMRTPIVPTVTGLLAVLVKQDSLEMALFVKVCGAFIVKNKAKPYSSRVTNSVFLFYHIQTSMSALRIPVLVMRTLIVPTVTGHLAVLVKQDSLEMALFVKVCGAFIVKNKAKPYSSRVTNSVSLFYHIQTSMSALRVPVLVMRTLIVPTVTGLIAVLVKKGSMEME